MIYMLKKTFFTGACAFLLVGKCLADQAGDGCIVSPYSHIMEYVWSCLKTNDQVGLQKLMSDYSNQLRTLARGTTVTRMGYEEDSPPIVKIRVLGEPEPCYAFKSTITKDSGYQPSARGTPDQGYQPSARRTPDQSTSALPSAPNGVITQRIETLDGTSETFIKWCSELTNLENVQISSDGLITAEMPKEDNNVKKAKSLADFLSRKWAEQSKSEHVICRIRLPDSSVVQSQP
jgi:hypothetical protein